MTYPKRLHPAVILPALVPLLLLAACGTDMQTLLSKDEAARGRAIETLVGDPSMSGEVIDRLLKQPAPRTAVFDKIIESDEILGSLIHQVMQSDRGKALVANQIASDAEMTRTFMGMMMLTGAVGEIMTQEQAERLDLGEAFAHGNQMRTMADLKRLGGVVDGWARENEGSYPACDDYEKVTGCLASRLPDGALSDLRLNDAWGRPFQYHGDDDGRTYVLMSYSTDGQYDGLGKAGPTSSYDADIVFSNGDFVQWPGSIRKEMVR
jgi:hypothetical protein